MRLPAGIDVIAMTLVADRATLLTVSENGFGKRTAVADYPRQKRGGQGVFTMKASGRNGLVVATRQVVDDDQVMLVTDSGRLVRIRMSGVSVIGRNTQGVKLIGCNPKEHVVEAVRVVDHTADNVEQADSDAESMNDAV